MSTPTSNPPPRTTAESDAAHRPAGGSVAVAPLPAPAPARSPGPGPNNGATHQGAPGAAATPGSGAAPANASASRAHAPSHAGRQHATYDLAPPRPKSKRKRLFLLFPILLTALCVTTLLGYRYWYETTYFVATDNASVTGDLVQVGSLNAGRIVATRVDVGRPVRDGQEIAVVAMPREIGSSGVGTAPRMGLTGTDDSLVSVYAPLNGIVAARLGQVGGTVTAGQPIYSLIDPARIWVRANIDEANAWRVQVGQDVEIHADALNRDFWGHVDAISPASAATFSLLPSGNASGNFTKVTQYVPVKIAVDAGGAVLPLGTSVEVRIQVRQPGSEWPLPWQP